MQLNLLAAQIGLTGTKRFVRIVGGNAKSYSTYYFEGSRLTLVLIGPIFASRAYMIYAGHGRNAVWRKLTQ